MAEPSRVALACKEEQRYWRMEDRSPCFLHACSGHSNCAHPEHICADQDTQVLSVGAEEAAVGEEKLYRAKSLCLQCPRHGKPEV